MYHLLCNPLQSVPCEGIAAGWHPSNEQTSQMLLLYSSFINFWAKMRWITFLFFQKWCRNFIRLIRFILKIINNKLLDDQLSFREKKKKGSNFCYLRVWGTNVYRVFNEERIFAPITQTWSFKVNKIGKPKFVEITPR